MSCRDCVFKGIYQDMGASCDVCKLQSDLVDAVKACENSANCHHRFTVAEAKKIVIEREGELPVIPQKEIEPRKETDSPKTLNDAFKEIAESVCNEIDAIMRSIQNLSTESEDSE